MSLLAPTGSATTASNIHTNTNTNTYRRMTTMTTTTTTHRPMSSSTTTNNSGNNKKPIALFLNASRLDYDHQLDFSKLNDLVDFRRNPQDYVTDPTQLLQLVHDHQPAIVITKEMHVPAHCVAHYPDSVKLLCEAGTGYNNLPIEAARARGMVVCNIPTYSTEAVAHMAITYLMNFSIQLFQQQRMLQKGDRSNFTGPFTLPLMELSGKTLGLVGGSGLIGSKVAEIALVLGMNIIISSRAGRLPTTHQLYNHPKVLVVAHVNDLLAASDFVSLHTPLNDQTRGSFGRVQFEQMKSTAYFINTSRGAVCNEAELMDCLERNVIAGAGLDVTASEPPPMDSRLWTLPNVWLTPHIGWRRLETRQRLVDMTYMNIKAYCEAKSPAEYINVVS
jgi:glycerate dehydrogenase